MRKMCTGKETSNWEGNAQQQHMPNCHSSMLKLGKRIFVEEKNGTQGHFLLPRMTFKSRVIPLKSVDLNIDWKIDSNLSNHNEKWRISSVYLHQDSPF